MLDRIPIIGWLRIAFRAYRDPTVPKWAKFLFGFLALGYLLLPIDLLPEAALGPIGLIDDLIIVPLLLMLVSRYGDRTEQGDAEQAMQEPPRKHV